MTAKTPWSTPADLRAQVQRLWDRGELLAALLSAEPAFPKRLALKTPTSGEIAGAFEAVRTWIAGLRAMPHCRLQWREVNHRVFGRNLVPSEAWVDTLEDALALIGKGRETGRFSTLVAETRGRQPALLIWLAKRPLRALELAGDWGRLLDIVAWLQAHPRPGLYLRQVDLPGVHSKFIEAHRGVLSELLDLALPPETIESSATGSAAFARRYGFRDKPPRIRFRLLDPQRTLLATGGEQDLSLDAGSFARLEPQVSRVFVTENEINYLALPNLPDSLAIFGAGYGFEVLAGAAWLSRCRIHYWGDIDTHGFAILDQLRAQFGQVQSFLMDRPTLLAFRELWGEEDKPTLRDLPRLNTEERTLYDDLRDNRLGMRIRLEQERIGFRWVERALAGLD